MVHTPTPWYATLFEEYSEIHIQSASKDYDNHVFTIHYGHSEDCLAHSNSLLSCNDDPDICGGLREAMSNAKLIVESVNDKTFGAQLLINTTLFDEVGV